MAMRDATCPTASAVAMSMWSSGASELEIFRLQCLFPAAGVGPFLDSKCTPALPQPLPGSCQPAPGVLSFGAGGSWKRSQLETTPSSWVFRWSQHIFASRFLYFLIATGTTTCYLCKVLGTLQTCSLGRGVQGPHSHVAQRCGAAHPPMGLLLWGVTS